MYKALAGNSYSSFPEWNARINFATDVNSIRVIAQAIIRMQNAFGREDIDDVTNGKPGEELQNLLIIIKNRIEPIENISEVKTINLQNLNYDPKELELNYKNIDNKNIIKTYKSVSGSTATSLNKEKKLYEEVKKIPSNYIEKNMNGYKMLLELNPENNLYKEKYNYYTELLEKKKLPITETMVLYDQFNIKSFYGGRQISKTYFIKESISNVIKKNPNIRQVETYRKVADESGATEYKSTYQINCETKQYTVTRHWSTGVGEDRGLFVDGKWNPVSEYEDMKKLSKHVCSAK